MLRLASVLSAVALLVTAAGVAIAPSSAGTPADVPRHHTWSSGPDWDSGTSHGLNRKGGRLVLAKKARIRTVAGLRQRVGTWTAPWTRSSLVELTTSWQAYTGRGSLTVSVRTRSSSGRTSSWDKVARWSSEAPSQRRTRGPQTDDAGRVLDATWLANDGDTPQDAWQVRLTLTDPVFGYSISNLYRIDVVTRAALSSPTGPTSQPGPAAGRKPLPAPRYSVADEVGGASWATAAAFVMALEGAGTTVERDRGPIAYAASKSQDDRTHTSDTFAFLTAFVSDTGGTSSWVTRLSGVASLEKRLVRREYVVVPLSGGARPVLVVGTEADGDVIVNDPSAPTDADVRLVIDRGSFESDWLASGGLAGIVRSGFLR